MQKYLKNINTRTARCNELDKKFGKLVKHHCPKTCDYCSGRCLDDEEAIIKIRLKSYTYKKIRHRKCNTKVKKKFVNEICSKTCQVCG